MKRKILVACNDPGGTMACIPVIKELNKYPGISLSIYAGKYAKSLMVKEGMPYKSLKAQLITSGQLPLIRKILRKEEPELVLTSTSFGKVLDNAFLYSAIKGGFKTFALIDYWCNYSSRFKVYSKIRTLPDYIGIMDEFTKKEMLLEGFPANRLIVTGHPYFDSLAGNPKTVPVNRQKAFRKRYNIDAGSCIIIFASEPFKKRDLERMGYSDITILKELLKALVEVRNGKSITLIIKIHPRDERNDSIFDINHAKGIRIITEREGKARDFIDNADIVTGMSSIFLVEAFLLGKPTLSILINRRIPDDLITNRMRLTTPIKTYKELCTMLKRTLHGKESPNKGPLTGKFGIIDGKSAGRAAKYIRNMLFQDKL